jgi:hypothetical protein
MIVPEVVSSKPDIMRKSVDLPQPEGPTKTTNSWSLISKFTSWMTPTFPKSLLIPVSCTPAIFIPYVTLVFCPALHLPVFSLAPDSDENLKNNRFDRYKTI